jgi:hypothetical protein
VTPATPSIRTIVERVRRSLRRDAYHAVALAALCAVPATLLTAWLLGLAWPWNVHGAGPLVLELAVFAVAATIAWRGIRGWIGSIDERAVAADAERTAGMPEGAVLGVLELSRDIPEGTSPALARMAERELGVQLHGVPDASLAAGIGASVRRRRGMAAAAFASLTLIVTLLGFASPARTRAAWTPLLHPVRHLMPPALPALVVEPGDAAVMRGADLVVSVTAQGREIVTLHWTMKGAVPRSDVAAVSGDSAVATIASIDAVTEYWVEAPDGAVSDHFTITPSDPLLLADLAVDVLYPPHVNRPSDHFQGDVPALEVPEGTQIVVHGRATRSLATAELAGAKETAARFTIDGDRFEGTFTPVSSGAFTWQLHDRSGGDLAVRPNPLEISVLPDAAPQVEITFPANDTVLDASLNQAIVADARDDYGLTDGVLVSWRVGRNGQRDADVEQAVDLSGTDRALIRALLDARDRSLVPGDTLRFYVRVVDNSPRHQTAVSRTISLRLPDMSELRDESTERARQMAEEAKAMAKASEQMESTTRGVEQKTNAANARRDAQQSNSGAEKKMDYAESAQARQVMEQQEELLKRMQEMRKQLDELESAMERAGLRDGALQKRLEELRKQYDDAQSPEMKQKMEELKKALENLDPEAIEKALKEMAEQQKKLKEQLERSQEMMQRAATEQEMNNLSQEARELSTQQQALAQTMEQKKPTEEEAKKQQEMSKRTEELAKSLGEMQDKLKQQGEQTTAEQTKSAQQDAQQAGKQMEQAAKDAAKQDGENAAKNGDQAAKQLERAADTIDKARQAMSDEWKKDAKQDIQQATQDALSLADQEQQLLDKMKQQQQKEQQGQKLPQTPQPGPPQAPNQPQAQPQTGQQQQGDKQQQQGDKQQQQGKQQGQQQQGQQQQGQQQQGQQAGQQQGEQGQKKPGEQPGQQGQQGQQNAQQQGTNPGQPGGAGSGDMQQMKQEQQALQQSLQQLGRNLQEAGEQNAMNRDVSAALARANLQMQQTLEAMQQGQMPTQQAQQTVDALNRLALSLLNQSQQQQQAENGSAAQQAQQQMADIAKQQGSLNGQTGSLADMNLQQQGMSQQMNRIAQEQMEIARRLGNMNQGGKESLNGDVDALAKEAEELAKALQKGQLPPETLARQQRLFHRLLDAGRSLEKDEVEEERKGERAGKYDPAMAAALDARLFQDPTKFRAPTADELSVFPPAMRRAILDYFERMNRAPAPAAVKSPGK